MKLELQFDTWALREPFVTARDVANEVATLTAVVTDGDLRGRGEALGVGYLGETNESMSAAIHAVQGDVERGIDVDELQHLLGPGGARNALDCALWDLKAKRTNARVWQLLAIDAVPVTTVFTLSLGSVEQMAGEARTRSACPVLKVKLDGQDTAEKIRAIRAARPDAEIVIDANGSWSVALLDELAAALVDNRVRMVEQPLPAGEDDMLAGFDFPVTLCADESCQSSADLDACYGRYGMINIKLDKCGGLTEAMRMVEACRERGLALMVGNMLGTSLAMAPAIVPAQFCRYVDLDGPLFQVRDRAHALTYRNGRVGLPDAGLWG